MSASDSFNEICTLRIELCDTDPLIWRQVEVPTPITLKVLHDIIQAAMGWLDYHRWEFTIGRQKLGPPIDQGGSRGAGVDPLDGWLGADPAACLHGPVGLHPVAWHGSTAVDRRSTASTCSDRG
jgi:pRiA4b ORF-3-like protein